MSSCPCFVLSCSGSGSGFGSPTARGSPLFFLCVGFPRTDLLFVFLSVGQARVKHDASDRRLRSKSSTFAHDHQLTLTLTLSLALILTQFIPKPPP